MLQNLINKKTKHQQTNKHIEKNNQSILSHQKFYILLIRIYYRVNGNMKLSPVTTTMMMMMLTMLELCFTQFAHHVVVVA